MLSGSNTLGGFLSNSNVLTSTVLASSVIMDGKLLPFFHLLGIPELPIQDVCLLPSFILSVFNNIRTAMQLVWGQTKSYYVRTYYIYITDSKPVRLVPENVMPESQFV